MSASAAPTPDDHAIAANYLTTTPIASLSTLLIIAIPLAHGPPDGEGNSSDTHNAHNAIEYIHRPILAASVEAPALLKDKI